MLTRKKDKPGKRSVIAMSEPKSINSEQYRTIRTNIEFSSVDTEVKSLLITSAGSRKKENRQPRPTLPSYLHSRGKKCF